MSVESYIRNLRLDRKPGITQTGRVHILYPRPRGSGYQLPERRESRRNEADDTGPSDPFTAFTGKPRWLVWREEKRGKDGKPTKVPYAPRTGRRASSTDPTDWAIRHEAERYAAGLPKQVVGGIGITLGDNGDGTFLVGVDLDSSLDHSGDLGGVPLMITLAMRKTLRELGHRDAAIHTMTPQRAHEIIGERGWLAPWAAAILEVSQTYAEISPSGNGLKAFLLVASAHVRPFLDLIGVTAASWGTKRSIPGLSGADHGPGVEVYARGRFFVVTGRTWSREHQQIALLDWPALEKLAALIPKPNTQGTATEKGVGDDEGERGNVDDHLPSLDDDATLKEIIRLGHDYDPQRWASRSEAVFFVAAALHRRHWEDAWIRRVLLDPVNGISAHCREEENPERAADNAIRNARASVREEVAEGYRRASGARAPDAAPFAERVFPTLDEAALYGLAGTVVRTIAPETESHPAALLFDFLVAFGNAAGRNPHWRVEADRHGANLYLVQVGRTSKGRKGTAWGHVRELIRSFDDLWGKECLFTSVLGSGEGLIHRLRDRDEPHDNRLLVYTGEFGMQLRLVTQRQGSIVSGIFKDAWDGLEVIHSPLIKSGQEKVTGAHVSMVGNITEEELMRDLVDTEIASGFANRCLFALSERAQLLPMGGRLAPEVRHALGRRIHYAIRVASQCGEIKFDPAAEELWCAVYKDVSAERPGMLGAVTARAEAQVRRLALNYTLLDCIRDTQIAEVTTRIEHLQAALAAWDYCFKTAAYIFGDMVGDPIADRILRAVRDAGEDGLSRLEISQLFARNQSASVLDRALAVLERQGYVRRAAARVGRPGGRPERRWNAVR